MMSPQSSRLFLEETAEILGEIEVLVLRLEDNPDDRDTLDQVFRGLHTIKGSSSMFGFDRIAEYAHGLETLFDELRSGARRADSGVVTRTLEAVDTLRSLLDDPAGSPAGDGAPSGAPSPSEAPAHGSSRGDVPAAATGAPLSVFRIQIEPTADLMRSGTQPLRLLEELQSLGEARVFAHTDKLPGLGNLDPEQIHVSWTVLLTTGADENAIRDVFIFVEDSCRVAVEELPAEFDPSEGPDYRRLGKILVERGDLSAAQVEQLLAGRPRLGELAMRAGLVDESRLEAALTEQRLVRDKAARDAAGAGDSSSIRVSGSKLDELVNLVGELVTLQSRLGNAVADREEPELVTIAEQLEYLGAALRESAMSMRMVEVRELFGAVRRSVRDTALAVGKEVRFEAEGAETELDKGIVDRLRDPIVHIVRNSVDHGIELPSVRESRGKDPEGVVRITAEYAGSDVVISVEDDGGGLDEAKILEKARRVGLVGGTETLSRHSIYALIFEPGFSTADQATTVSGRGVGMDVVRRNVEALSGSIDVASEAGKGTTIRLRIPLTLAIIDALVLRVEDENYIVHADVVTECRIQRERIIPPGRTAALARLEDETLPFVSLRSLFCVPGPAPEIENTVVARLAGSTVAIVVDEILGRRQVVVKPLDEAFRDIGDFSGSTILGDGSVALILDLDRIAGIASAAE